MVWELLDAIIMGRKLIALAEQLPCTTRYLALMLDVVHFMGKIQLKQQQKKFKYRSMQLT